MLKMTWGRSAFWLCFSLCVACGGSSPSEGPRESPDASDIVADAELPEDAAEPPEEVDAEVLRPFDAWREARDVLRKSPDHLLAQAERVVALKDPKRIFEFVRDSILTYPSAEDGFASAVAAQRWGAQGTLRGGAGTPREKAELLVSLYVQAGFQAEVVQGRADPARLDGKQVLLRVIERAYEVEFSEEQLARFRQALGEKPARSLAPIDPNGAEADALAASLRAQLSETLEAPFDFTLDAIPLVRVKVDNAWVFANPIAPDADFGDSVTLATPTPTSGAYATQRVRVRVEAARADKPFERFALVEREYTAEEVVGRRIHLTFAPPVRTEKLVRMRAEDVETFAPVLSVASPGMSQEDRDVLAKVGDVFTLGGDRFSVDGAGNLTINGQIVQPGSSDAEHVARVHTLDAGAQPAAFPRVSLRVKALDADGTGVAGLGADAFKLEEEGRALSFTLTENKAPPPRVVLLFDVSTSVPTDFRGAGAVSVADQIIEPLYAAYPDAQVRVGVVTVGTPSFFGTGWATSAVLAKAQAAQLATAAGGSMLWQALQKAAELNPTLTVVVTDADATDEPIPAYRNAIVAGPPVLALGVGPVKTETLSAFAALSAGQSFSVALQSEVVDSVRAMIGERATQDYALQFTAPLEGPAVRRVKVTLNGKEATVSYQVPTYPATPRALSGLYLTLSVGGRQTTRALAGVAQTYATPGIEVTQAELDDVRALLLGRVSIAVEAAAPPPSVVLDEWLSEKLEFEPLWNAIATGDEAIILEALKLGTNLTPAKLPLAQPPLLDSNTEQALTFETSLRVAALVQKVRAGGTFSRQLDLFPLTRFRTAAEDPRQAWERTLRATSALAVSEAGLMTGPSTLEALASVALTSLPAGQARAQAGLSDGERAEWALLESPFSSAEYQLLVPLKPGPFWAVHKPSGSLIGVLADGSGGASESICANYNLANSLLQLASLVGGLFGASVGGWVALAQWEVKMVTMATLVIAGAGDATPISNPALDMGCGILDDAIGDLIPGYGLYGSIVDTLETSGADTGLPTLCGGGDDDVCS